MKRAGRSLVQHPALTKENTIGYGLHWAIGSTLTCTVASRSAVTVLRYCSDRPLLAQSGRSLAALSLEEQEERAALLSSQGIFELADQRKSIARMVIHTATLS